MHMSPVCELYQFSPQPCKAGTIIISVLRMRKLNLSSSRDEMNEPELARAQVHLVPDHRASPLCSPCPAVGERGHSLSRDKDRGSEGDSDAPGGGVGRQALFPRP